MPVGFEFARDNTLQEQAEWDVQAFQLMRQWGFVRLAFLWNLDYAQKGGIGETDPNAPYSILDFNGAPRPAFDALSRMPKVPKRHGRRNRRGNLSSACLTNPLAHLQSRYGSQAEVNEHALGRDRLSTLLALTLTSATLFRFVELPTFSWGVRRLLGSPLGFTLGGEWLLSLLMIALVASGTFALLHEKAAITGCLRC